MTSGTTPTQGTPNSNFWMLANHQPELAKLGARAEQYFSEDPNTTLLKLRQFTELLAQTVAAQVGDYTTTSEEQISLLRRLESNGHLTREVAQVFHQLRKLGNTANHQLLGTHSDALSALKLARQLAIWYHRCTRQRDFKSSPFIPPAAPQDSTESLQTELARLQKALDETTRKISEHKDSAAETKQQLEQSLAEKEQWKSLAEEAEKTKAELAAKLEEIQSAAAANSEAVTATTAAMTQAAELIEIDEATTRTLIDQQLRDAGWEADSSELRYSRGTRPQKGRNLAIAEWPTSEGRADYVLFVGLTPIAVVEAKKKNVEVAAALKQAKRYSREFTINNDMTPADGQPWGKDQEYKIPFGFSTNGRPYLKQLEDRSGIWFVDMRRATNHGRALSSWYTPDGLAELLKLNQDAAENKLAEEAFDYDLRLRKYQIQAIKNVEQALANGQREMLVAMATGTGKTKTAIALAYRLLKAQRFRRILFVVDRFALGDQAASDFKSTRLENLQTFADVFGLKELSDIVPERDTSLHIATIQGLIKRTLYSDEPPAVDQYDCIIVDECHRGYLLDRDLSDTELEFRDQADYVSKYRRVLEYFDAVKIGLTATPALHTTQIFGPPVMRYTYRQAVIDDVLIDHEPPINILTRLSRDGIRWAAGEEVGIYNPANNQVDYLTAPDEIAIDVEGFNKKVITENFNRAVCQHLAEELDPSLPGKTLIFCATDFHADMVVRILKEELQARYGNIDDDAVEKITSKADKPLDLILKYKNEKLPNIAVTVDLLTTGIDVPEIVNLVFLRRVNSRILYEQMLGRATRRCDHIGKEVFRIFDAVDIYQDLQEVTDMQPVVVNPQISFSRLGKDITSVNNLTHVALTRDQFVAKLLRKRRHLTESQTARFEKIAGQTPEEFIQELRSLPPEEIANWFVRHALITEILDEQTQSRAITPLVSHHEDEVVSVSHGYGRGQKPEDYLEEFKRFIQENGNKLPAMQAVLQRPRDLTRKELKELMLALDEQGYSEKSLESAWRDMTNQEIAARIIGFVRQAALGDPLKPWSERVDNALRKMLSSRTWTNPQKQWLEKIAAQTKANLVVDKDAMNDSNQLFKREAGGFDALNRKFDGQLEDILHNFNELIWNPDAA